MPYCSTGPTASDVMLQRKVQMRLEKMQFSAGTVKWIGSNRLVLAAIYIFKFYFLFYLEKTNTG